MARSGVLSSVKAYQTYVKNSLHRIMNPYEAKEEWNVAKDSQDAFTRELYSPRLDVAVGPFNIDGNIERNNKKIRRAANRHQSFIEQLICCSELESPSFDIFLRRRNKNPRCFLAIEIENSGSSKHMLGDIANVSIIGSIGIVIPFNEKKQSLCERIKRYVRFCSSVGKIDNVFTNVLVISKEDFHRVIRENLKSSVQKR